MMPCTPYARRPMHWMAESVGKVKKKKRTGVTNWLTTCECNAINEAPLNEYWMRWQNKRLIYTHTHTRHASKEAHSSNRPTLSSYTTLRATVVTDGVLTFISFVFIIYIYRMKVSLVNLVSVSLLYRIRFLIFSQPWRNRWSRNFPHFRRSFRLTIEY